MSWRGVYWSRSGPVGFQQWNTKTYYQAFTTFDKGVSMKALSEKYVRTTFNIYIITLLFCDPSTCAETF